MYAVEAATGRVAWSFPAGRPIHGEATVTADAVYFASDNGRLYRLHRDSGKEAWRYELDDGRVARILPNPFVFDYDHIAPRPVLADGVLYVGAADGSLHAVDAARGTRIWRFQGEGKVRSSAAVQGEAVVFGTLGNRIYQLDRASGREIRRWETSGPVTEHAGLQRRALHRRRSRQQAGGPAPGTGRAGLEPALLGLVDRVERRRRSAAPAMSARATCSWSRPSIRRSGRNLWRTHVGGWVVQRPALSDDRVFVSVSGARRRPAHFLEQTSGLMALDRRDGRIVWHWPAPSLPGTFLFGVTAAPALSGRHVLCAALDGSLYAFVRDDVG